MITVAAVVILLPFVSAAVGLLGSRFPGGARGGPADLAANRRAAWIAVVPTAISTVLAIWLVYADWTGAGEGRGEPFPGAGGSAGPPTVDGVTGTLDVIPTGSLPISVGLLVDALAASTAVLVTVVALAVQVYSIGYMAADRRYPSYSSFISLFTSAMLLVVYAADLLLLYVGWEVMGLCSYLLIGHWWEDRANSRAAVKSFLVTRLGDVGFLFGIFVLGAAAGSFRIADVIAKVPEMSSGTVITATMLLLAGVAGKSAQVPLHTWLPDAMAGPTPISALIHAATMVAAGIFLVARLYPVFIQAGPTLDVLAVLAALGMLGAALAALAQNDLKRVLAYSTISQLAYMAGALAAGSESAAIFHLITHGAFKALLFLCAGAVIHAVGSNLMSAMGGLRRQLPVTFAAMTIGFAALMGLPPASGFFSKDEVLVAMERALAEGPLTDAAALLLYGCALATVAVTGAYATRAWLRTFFGERRGMPHTPGAAHTVVSPESGTARAAVPRDLGTSHEAVPRDLGPPHAVVPQPGVVHAVDVHETPATMRWPIVILAVPALLLGFAGVADVHWGTAALGVVLALLGAGVVYAVWRSDPLSDPARVLGPFRTPFEQAFYVDSAYRALFVLPVLHLARLVARTDDRVVDGAVRGSGRATLGLAGLTRLAQNGNAQLYVTGLLAGVLILAVGAVMLA
ncbi:NADH-quinone oxidoreductase subunit L [Streptosporangium carneum]|uniref:NADH dehydrogenase n=1 Tax=Streptosporangium carneum TaxID=47481 RepID=A0A9W6I957_9ACTN|nr:NADH-quinone oxidoreductase subunit L [Streptosporangium carneum]GLK14386.1 NADH dehydrogenase [Streptosporangium carneum]